MDSLNKKRRVENSSPTSSPRVAPLEENEQSKEAIVASIHNISSTALGKEVANISNEEFKNLVTHWDELNKQIQTEKDKRKASEMAEIARQAAIKEEKRVKERKALIQSQKCFGCKNVFEEEQDLNKCTCFDEDGDGFQLCEECLEKEEHTGTKNLLTCTECSKSICGLCDYTTCTTSSCERVICEKCIGETDLGSRWSPWKYCKEQCGLYCDSCMDGFKTCTGCHDYGEKFCDMCIEKSNCDECGTTVCDNCLAENKLKCGNDVNLCESCKDEYECFDCDICMGYYR